MIAEEAVRAQLLQDPGINLLVQGRVYPHDEQPQAGSWPRVTYQRISTVAQPLLDGTDEELNRVRLQLNCLGETRAQVRALVWQLRRLFRNGRAWAGVLLAKVDGHGDLPREPDTRTHGARIDLLVTLEAAEAA